MDKLMSQTKVDEDCRHCWHDVVIDYGATELKRVCAGGLYG